MKSFSELKTFLENKNDHSGIYKGKKYRISKLGSSNTLYVNNEKIDVYRSEKEAVKAAKEFIDLSK